MISLFLSPPALLLILAALVIHFLFIMPLKAINSYKGPGVKTFFFPIIGYMKYLRTAFNEKGDILAYSKEIVRSSPNRKYIVSNVASKVVIILQDPQYIKEFLSKPQFYNKSRISHITRKLAGQGLVASEGEVWKRHRRIISSSFHYEFLESNINLVRKTSTDYFDNLSVEDFKKYDAIGRIQQITGEVVGRIFFGENLNSYTFEGKPLTIALAGLVMELAPKRFDIPVILFGPKMLEMPIFPSYKKIMARAKQFRKLCLDIIQQRKAKPESGAKDLLSSLLATQKSEDPNNRFSDEEILNEFTTFFIAGMDTTGHLIGMSLYNLTAHPEYLKKLEEEREKTYNNKDKKLSSETLGEMEILHSFLKETLRFYTPAPSAILRTVVADHDILDLKVKKGQFITSDYLYSAFDENNFEEPEKFNPERWISANSKGKIDPYAFVPFSAGPRNCIGQHLALIESKIILSEFLERFEFALPSEYELKMNFRFMYGPKDNLFMTLRPKNK